MAYDNVEQSIDSGYPIELYQFTIGPDTYFYTSSDEDVVYQSITYRSDYIERPAISQSREEARNRLKIKVGKDNAVANLFKQQPPFYEVNIIIVRYHRNDPDEPDVRFIFRGKVLSVDWPDGLTTAVLDCESLLGSLKSEAMRERFQHVCNHTIYTSKCGLDFQLLKDTYSVTAISIDGKTITCPGVGLMAADFYKGGVLRFGSDIWVMVVDHSGDDVQIFRAIPTLTIGASVDMGRACRNIRENCINFFNNYENYRGWPDVPLVNIFTGDGLKSQK